MRVMKLSAFLSVSLIASADAWGYCSDNDSSCANWAAAGECEKGDHVKKLCPHSCGSCNFLCRGLCLFFRQPFFTTTTLTPRAPADTNEQCAAWKDGGQCDENFDYMATHCPASCGICKTKCYDKDPACGDWSRKGECATNQGLLTLCPVSCGVCTDLCLDKQNDCPRWAASGNCGENPGYMLLNCPKSCNVCDDESHAKAGHPAGEKTETKACADTDRSQCLIWGDHECNANPAAVMKSCPSMCGLCTLACEDKYRDCPNWAEGKKSVFGSKSGKGCDEDADFMYQNCPHSCGICPRLHVFDTAKTEL